MFKRILALLLCAFTLVSVTACGGDGSSSTDSSTEASTETSTETSQEGTSTDASTDASTETSKDDSSSAEPENYVDKDGYEQFLKVSAVDDLLAERGFKDQGANSDYVPLNYDKMKAIWISQFDFELVYCNGPKQRSESSFKRLVEQAYNNLLSLGFNTVLVQVRPNADCFYPSAYYPYSHYTLGSYGKMAKYDPIQIMIDLAHEKGLSFHAWINPMRGMSSENLAKVDDSYPMKSWTLVANKARCSRYLYTHSDGLNYLNISYEEVRQLIIDAAAEIVRYYDVDGVHMDDYFYFGEPKFDEVELKQAIVKDATMTLQKFRYKNLSTLVSGIYSAIKAENKNVLFGISPAGNLDQMETKYYADMNTWLSKDGYLDYIMPQIYFGMEHQSWSFPTTYQRWSEITTNPKIKFMAGMSLGKALAGASGSGDQYAGTGRNEWIDNKDVFKKCFEYSVQQPNYDGYAIFCYQYFWHPISGKEVSETAEEIKNCKSYFTDIIKGEPIKY